jgi:glycosyltransferase involved in cell wall biosynthesis
MARFVPVISTNYPGSGELIKNGVTGFVCNNKRDYVNKVIKLLTNEAKRDEMGENAYKYVKQFHSSKNLDEFTSLLI